MQDQEVLHGSRMQKLSAEPDIINELAEESEPMSEQDNPNEAAGEAPAADINDDFLVDVPDIPMPEEGVEEADIVRDDCDVAFKFAFIGAGQGGSRIAEAFHKLGYNRVCAINTTNQDLVGIDIPEANKLVIGEGGAGKDPAKGAKAAEANYEEIFDHMRRCFGNDFDRIFVCIGAGGGTGSGACDTLVEIAHDVARSLKVEKEGEPAVGVIVSLPKVAEGGKVNANAHAVLDALFHKVGSDNGKLGGRTISPLIILDNDCVNKIHPNVSVEGFWGLCNKNISSLFHLFNSIAKKDSDYTTFDSADFEDILRGGVMTFGACPIKGWGSSTDISHAIRDNLKRNVLVGGFDLSQASKAGCVFIAHPEVLGQIPQDYLEHGFEMLTRIMRQPSVVHRGIYKGSKPGLVVYSILGELGRPDERMAEIARVGGVTVSKKK